MMAASMRKRTMAKNVYHGRGCYLDSKGTHFLTPPRITSSTAFRSQQHASLSWWGYCVNSNHLTLLSVPISSFSICATLVYIVKYVFPLFDSVLCSFNYSPRKGANEGDGVISLFLLF